MIFGGAEPSACRQHKTPEFIAHSNYIKDFYNRNIIISTEKSRWDNTIASYWVDSGDLDIYWTNAPSGAGWNLYSPGLISYQEKYVLIPESWKDTIEVYILSNYIVLEYNDEVILLQKP